MEAKEYNPMSLNELVRSLQRYTNDAQGLYGRWIAAILKPVIDTACEADNNRLSDENKADFEAFRASEIETEIRNKQKELDKLERDLAVLRRKVA